MNPKPSTVHGSGATPEADWATREDARAAVFEYIEVWYNRQRRHSSLGYLSPVAYEIQHAARQEFTKAA